MSSFLTKILFFTLLSAGILFPALDNVLANNLPVGTNTVLSPEESAKAIKQAEICRQQAASCIIGAGCTLITLDPKPVFDCTMPMTNLIKCVEEANKNNALCIEETNWQIFTEEVNRREAEEKRNEALAKAFKGSLEMFSRTLARDLATWVASGGRGQQPLFVTEGWGAYMKNIGDAALGDFIDGVGQTFGMDLCQPNFQFKLAVQIGLDQQQFEARCTFTEMMTNWQSAVTNANFAFEYQMSMRPGSANNISYALIMAEKRNSYVADRLEAAEKELQNNKLWESIKNVAGNILTPGSFIKEKFFESQSLATATKGKDIFTGTAADFIEEFLNTLVAQLLKNFQMGFFGSKDEETSDRDFSGIQNVIRRLGSLFSPFSSPTVVGESGAKERFFKLTDDQIKVGSSYDILVKLAQCSDTAKTNPGPTDCVIDQALLQAIRNKRYVHELPDEIKNRLFAPMGVNSENLETSIPYRSILILRKYRIVPVGWEIAARLLQTEEYANQPVTLGQLLDKYQSDNVSDPFFGLVEPYWLLKAPEVYCRRLGYGGHNEQKDSQDGTISRSEYCADEEQCLREDSKGNCLAYGYCQEERRFWRIGTECDARYNTCQTYTARTGSTGSWLTNTLDFRYCNAQNAGCRSYATVFNYGSKEWNGDINYLGSPYRYSTNATVNQTVSITTTTTNSGNANSNLLTRVFSTGYINEGEYVNDAYHVRMMLPCSESSCKLLGNEICQWDPGAGLGEGICKITGTCEVPAGEISCSLDNCSYDYLGIINSGFADSEINQAFNATHWTDERSYLNYNNRHYRAEVFGRNNATTSALHLTAVRNTKQLITTNAIVENLKPSQKYKLNFWLKGTITQGKVIVGVYTGIDTDTFYATYPEIKTLKTWEFSSGSSFWREVEFSFNTEAETLELENIKLAIITTAGSITDLYLDDFTLQRTSNPDCVESGVKFYRVFSNILTSPSNIHLDRDTQSCSAAAEGCTEFIRPNQPADKSALYLKKAPAQFQCYGTPNATSTYPATWPTSANLLTTLSGRKPECSFFAQLCTLAEVGCELYRPVNGGPDVPGVVSTTDYCPEVCVGYQVYKQEKTNFTTGSYRQFIADDNALYCSVGNVGCDEFTNLDNINQGAEEKEYFSYFRRCQINNDPNYNDARPFYTWEGSDTTGYQLVSYNLKRSNQGTGNNRAPCTKLTYNANGKGNCTDQAVEVNVPGYCTAEEMLINSDCRQFYDSTGASHYRLLSETIIVSNNCHPYRRTQTEAASTQAQTNCTTNGGWWKTSSECVYMGDPDYSRTCPASAKGCRAYTGNQGNNIRNVIESHFDGNNLNDLRWTNENNNKDGLQISLEATFPGGYSLTDTGSDSYLQHPVNLKAGHSYTLSFWAKGNIAFNINKSANDIYLTDSSGTRISSSRFKEVSVNDPSLSATNPRITKDWQYYELGPVFINQDYTDADLVFYIGGSRKIYLDNVILKETTNNIYLVENSWFTPVSCDNLMDNPQGTGCSDSRCFPGEHLGCSAYTDRSNALHYLRSFTSLCRPDAVGCEKLRDTFNFSATSSITYNISNEVPGNSNFDKVNVPADREVYLVNNTRHQCAGEDKGCQALGLPLVDTADRIYGYSTVFLKNNPDRYGTDLCRDGEVWCEEFAGNNSLNYFKDPRNKTCDYRDVGVIPGWYRTGTNQACVTTTNMTYGTGYAPASEKVQPIGLVNNALPGATVNASYSGWAGTCPPTQSSCSEYVDPLPSIYPELENVSTISGQYIYRLRPYVLYQSDIDITGACSIVRKDNTNLYYVNSGNICVLNRTVPAKIRIAGTYYSLRDSVDYSSCNGLVDFRDGCILVDDRSQLDYSTSSASYASRFNYLIYRAETTYQANMSANPQAVSPSLILNSSVADTSKIVKARADRECANFLYCTTYEKQDPNDPNRAFTEYDTCLNLASCSYMDQSGRCLSFTDYASMTAQLHNTSTDYFSNKTGYAMVGLKGYPDVPGYYQTHLMPQEGISSYVTNGDFENFYSDMGEPIGWKSVDILPTTVNPTMNDIKQPEGWMNYKFNFVADPKDAPEGSHYLKLNTFYEAESEDIFVEANSTYYVSFWINTLNLQSPNSIPIASVLVRDAETDGAASTWTILKKVEAGLGWQHFTVSTTTGPTTRKIRIKLKNCYADGECINYIHACNDYDQNSPCSLSGSSFFDDVRINSVLKTNDDTRVSRTCRVFPEKNARSCAYWDNDNFYYGQYGYCLMTDPKNNKQCLQWLPIDSLQGEMANEISGYYGRTPLYYCVEKTPVTQDIILPGNSFTFNKKQVGNEWSGWLSLIDRDPDGIKFTGIERLPEHSVFYRYPYIRIFTYTGMLFAYGDDNIVCTGGPIAAVMHKDGVIVGGATLICFKLGWPPSVKAIIPIPPMKLSHLAGEHILENDFRTFRNNRELLSRLYWSLNDTVTNWASNALSWAEPVFKFFNVNWDYNLNTWGGWGLLHVPLPLNRVSDNLGVILPAPWSVVAGDQAGIITQIFAFMSTFFTDGDNLKSYGMLQMKIVTQDEPTFGSAVTDPVTDLPGDILGMALKLNSAKQDKHYVTGIVGNTKGRVEFNYCSKFIRAVKEDGENKVFASRMNPGSGYILTNDNGSKTGRYLYYDPFEWDKFITCPDAYQSSDYVPFGSIVQPRDTADPRNWDSRSDIVYRQPLYYEVPRVEAFEPPYQARMGELHNVSALKRLFAQTYGAWEWFGKGGERNPVGGYREITGVEADNYNWDLPTAYCASYFRSDSNLPCLVRPQIYRIRSEVNSGNGVRLSFNVKIDPDQLPLTGITVYWGDGEITSYSSVRLRSRPNPENPIVINHYYNYQKIRDKVSTAPTGISYIDTNDPHQWYATKVGDSYDLRITLKIRDHWEATGTASTTINISEMGDFRDFDDGTSFSADTLCQSVCADENSDDCLQCFCNNYILKGDRECYQDETCCANNCKWLTTTATDKQGNQCVSGCQGTGILAPNMHTLNIKNDGCCDINGESYSGLTGDEYFNNDFACPLKADDTFSLLWIGNSQAKEITIGTRMTDYGNAFLSVNNGDWMKTYTEAGCVDDAGNPILDADGKPTCSPKDCLDDDGNSIECSTNDFGVCRNVGISPGKTEDNTEQLGHCLFDKSNGNVGVGVNANRYVAAEWERFRFSGTGFVSTGNNYSISTYLGINWKIHDRTVDNGGRVLTDGFEEPEEIDYLIAPKCTGESYPRCWSCCEPVDSTCSDTYKQVTVDRDHKAEACKAYESDNCGECIDKMGTGEDNEDLDATSTEDIANGGDFDGKNGARFVFVSNSTEKEKVGFGLFEYPCGNVRFGNLRNTYRDLLCNRNLSLSVWKNPDVSLVGTKIYRGDILSFQVENFNRDGRPALVKVIDGCSFLGIPYTCYKWSSEISVYDNDPKWALKNKWLKITDSFEQSLIVPSGTSTQTDYNYRGKFMLCDENGFCGDGDMDADYTNFPAYCRR